MRKSASRLEEPSSLGELLREGLVLTGGAILARPALVGGTTAFLVATAFVSANALWYQPYQHTGAFFTTRALIQHEPAVAVKPQPRPAVERLDAKPAAFSQPAQQPTSETTASLPSGDPQVALVQRVLKKLELYEGEVDGLAGPQTSGAVEHYQRLVGMTPNGQVDETLLRQLGIATQAADAAPVAAEGAGAVVEKVAVTMPANVPVPRPRPTEGAKMMQADYKAPDPTIVRIQAGLKAFGNDGIELDGKVGARTRSAIREFQSLFGLKVTGEPDAAVYAKMREIGLTE